MVKRRREEDIAGVVEFAGIQKDDPQFIAWMNEHKDRNGGKIRVSLGATGARVAFAKEADMVVWKKRFDQLQGRRLPSRE